MPADHIAITLPDGSVHDHETGATGYKLAGGISAGLARQALAVRVNGEVWDLTRPIDRDARIEILTWNDPEGQLTFRHSTAHLMAEALESLFPGVKFGIGPPIEQGFYYDVDTGDHHIGTEDLERIEKRMRELAARDVAYERRDISKKDAIQYFRDKGDEYKLELLEDLEDGTITFYRQGDFVDLCRGPHIPSTGRIKYVKLLNIAGAYWRGDERRPQLTRIYGVSFPKKSMLDEHLERLALAAQRDHRKLGRELALFTFDRQVGAGLPMWLPRGAVLRETLVDFLKKEQLSRGYEPVVTPHIGRLELYKTSGHYPYYREHRGWPVIGPDLVFSSENPSRPRNSGAMVGAFACRGIRGTVRLLRVISRIPPTFPIRSGTPIRVVGWPAALRRDRAGFTPPTRRPRRVRREPFGRQCARRLGRASRRRSPGHRRTEASLRCSALPA